MTLRPGGGSARLLLELWARTQESRPIYRHFVPAGDDRAELLDLGYAQQFEVPHCLILTQAGRYAAQTLDASSR